MKKSQLVIVCLSFILCCLYSRNAIAQQGITVNGTNKTITSTSQAISFAGDTLKTTGTLNAANANFSVFGTGNTGLATYNASGILQPLNFNGNANTVLTGAGTFVPLTGGGGSGGVSGTGTKGYIPVWTTTTKVGNSPIAILGGNVGIGTTTPKYPLHVFGDAAVTGTIYGQNIYAQNNLSAGNFRFVNGTVMGVSDTIASQGTIEMNAKTVDVTGTLAAQTLMATEAITAGPKNSHSAITMDGTTGTITSASGTVGFANNTIATEGAMKAAALNVSGNSVAMPGIVTENTTDLMTIDRNGVVKPLTTAALNSIIFPSNVATLNGFPNPCSSATKITSAWSYPTTAEDNPAVTTWNNCVFVGIDNQAPTVPLEVGGAAIIDGSLTTTGLITGGGATLADWLHIGKAPSGTILLNIQPILPGTDFSNFIQVNNYKGTSLFTLDPSGNTYVAGNVLIQTTNNEYALNVGGTIWATEVKVCVSGGCDFVFDKGYKLMPLYDLEQYLQLNHHLPGIASAKEMESGDGIALGKLNTQLLQKVEELTLYTIELKKQLDEMQAEINKLKVSK